MKEQPGQVVKSTTIREVLPPNQAKERTTPDFWEYVAPLTASDWDRHIVYLYRVEDNRSIPLEKCSGSMQIGGGRSVPINDREEMELAIGQKYGGRTFRLILKRGSERVTETRVFNDLPPKNVQPAIFDSGPSVQPMSDAAATADVAKAAMSAVASQEANAVNVAVTALRGAAEVVQRFSQPQNGGTQMDDIMKPLLVAMLQRAMNPPDPIELLTKLLTLQNSMTTSTAARTPGTPDEFTQKVMGVAFERFMNPPPAGPVSSAGAELVRTLPSVATHVTDAIREWRLGMEAQRDGAAIMRGIVPPRPAAPPGARSLPAPAANPTEAPMPVPGVPLEFIEAKIVEMLTEPVSAEEAADDTMAFLDRIDPKLVAQLVSLGEPGLFNLFQTRPILKTATTNVPRLAEFIRAFLKFATENAAAGAGESGKQQLPN